MELLGLRKCNVPEARLILIGGAQSPTFIFTIPNDLPQKLCMRQSIA